MCLSPDLVYMNARNKPILSIILAIIRMVAPG